MSKVNDFFSDQLSQQLPGVPVLELAGDRRILIENYIRVLEYGADCIGICVRYGTVCIHGSCLKIARMTRANLVIVGSIDSICLKRKDGMR